MAKTTLPSVGTLLKNSWTTFTEVWARLLLFNLIGLAAGGLIAILGLFLLGITIIFPLRTMIQHGGHSLSPSIYSQLLPQIAIVFGIFGILLFILFSFLQVGSILIIGDKKQSIHQLIKKSFTLLIPFVIVRLLVLFFVGGSFFLLVFPSFLMTYLLIFASYEVILGKSTQLSTLRRSYALIQSNFWGLLARVLLIIIVTSVVSYMPRTIIHLPAQESWIWVIVGILLTWFETCYLVTLYKYVSKAVPASRKSGLLRLGIFATIGWIIGILFITLFIQGLAHVSPGIIQDFMKKYNHTSQKSYQVQNGNNIRTILPSSSVQRN